MESSINYVTMVTIGPALCSIKRPQWLENFMLLYYILYLGQTCWKYLNPCFTLPWFFLVIKDQMSLTRMPRHFICFGHVHSVSPLLDIVCPASSWFFSASVPGDGATMQHMYAYINCPLLLHGQSIATSFSWPLPESDVSVTTLPVLSCWFYALSSWFTSSLDTCSSVSNIIAVTISR